MFISGAQLSSERLPLLRPVRGTPPFDFRISQYRLIMPVRILHRRINRLCVDVLEGVFEHQAGTVEDVISGPGLYFSRTGARNPSQQRK